jgi:hypothetical protein
MLSVEADGLVVLSRDHPVRVDRKDVCDVMTYQSAGGRKAKYAGAFGVVGARFGVMSWYAKNLGDQQNTNLAREVAIGGGVAALIGLAIEGLYQAAAVPSLRQPIGLPLATCDELLRLRFDPNAKSPENRPVTSPRFPLGIRARH